MNNSIKRKMQHVIQDYWVTDDQKQNIHWEQDEKYRRRPYDHPIVRYFSRQRVAYIGTWLDMQHIRNALDVGCGTGFSTWYMHEQIPNTWGVDRSLNMIMQSPLHAKGHVAIADGFELPFADNTFDLVYGWEILHHMSDPTVALREMARVSRQYVLVAEPNRSNPAQFLYAVLDREHRWVLRYTLPYMRSLFTVIGLQVDHASRGGYIFPKMTPFWLFTLVQYLPYRSPIGISNWVLGRKQPALCA